MHLLFSSISVKISTGSVSPERGENMGHIRSSSGIFLLLLISCIAFLNLITTSMASESAAEDGTPFTYVKGTGRDPTKWGLLNPNWTACGTGKLQSPIDLPHRRSQIHLKLGKLMRDYQPAPAVVINRGHDITVKWKGDAGDIVIDGTRYNLLQCHWHSPAEHTLSGVRHQLELHLVHVSAQRQIAVIGILYKYGRPDPFLQKLLHHIKVIDKEEIDLGVVNPGIIKFGGRKFFRYIGSLTVPPCTEGVVWTIVDKVRTVSLEQIRALREAVHDGFEANARPTQRRDGRPIYLYTPEDYVYS